MSNETHNCNWIKIVIDYILISELKYTANVLVNSFFFVYVNRDLNAGFSSFLEYP